MDAAHYLADARKRFLEARSQCERALAQVPFDRWNLRLDPEANSIVTLMLHLSGNMVSRWTSFLTSDGEKSDRHRDAEFEDLPGLSREALLARWDKGWEALFQALDGLGEGDLERTVLIRSQPQSVTEAINRQLTHYAYHAGQLVFLAKHLASGPWESLSIPRGHSAAFNAAMPLGSRILPKKRPHVIPPTDSE